MLHSTIWKTLLVCVSLSLTSFVTRSLIPGALAEQRIIGVDLGASHITSWYFDQGKPVLVDRMRGSDEYCSLMGQVGPAGREVENDDHQFNRSIVDLLKGYVKHMETTAASSLGRSQKVGAFTYPQWASSSWEVSAPLYEAMSVCGDDFFLDRALRSDAGAALTYLDNNCFRGWTDPGDINYDQADEVLVIESYLDEIWAMYLQLTNNGPLGGGKRKGQIAIKADYRELAKALGELDRKSSNEISAVIISGDLSPQEAEYIRSNVSQELPHLENKFKPPYAGPEHVNAIGAACFALHIENYAGPRFHLMPFDDDQVGHDEL